MDGSLSNKPKNFVNDPEKIYKQRRREARSRKPELVDPKVEADDSSSSPQATPPTSPKETIDGVLLAGQDPDSAQQDCNIRASPDGDYCGSL